ncbi:unnamed protein product [Phyllotreta striolata]|uniref:Uncharacterized protein n=1 Tax=Phyllotreta striolata TaxID=444603 RepID=A0A9N9XRT0_PHYSR|nr:unnamed protein product [Phyllotreta striolata]
MYINCGSSSISQGPSHGLSHGFCKANSPSRNWIINSNKFAGNRPYARRSSNTPVSSLALNSFPPVPNRSRSLDGLLDTAEAPAEATNEQIPSSFTTNRRDDIKTDLDEGDKVTDRSKAEDFSSDALENDDKSSVHSNSSESKRKRNFMDRCVNKVRSFIKKVE